MVRTACKWLGIFSIAAVVAAGGVYWWLARDRAPTHPALAAADLPPMIPFRDFWASRDSEWGYVISPGKTWISWRAVDVATQLINIRRRGGERVATIETTQGARYWWDADTSIPSHSNRLGDDLAQVRAAPLLSRAVAPVRTLRRRAATPLRGVRIAAGDGCWRSSGDAARTPRSFWVTRARHCVRRGPWPAGFPLID